jgi:hypothetical protein
LLHRDPPFASLINSNKLLLEKFFFYKNTMVSPASVIATTTGRHKIKKQVYKNNPYQCQYASLSINISRQQSTTLRIHLAKEVLHVTILPKMDYFHSPHKPLCHQFKGQSNSSERVDIAKHLLVNECTLTAAGIVSSCTATYRKKTT